MDLLAYFLQSIKKYSIILNKEHTVKDIESKYEDIITSIVGVSAYQVEGIASLSSESDNKLTGKLFSSVGKGIQVDMMQGNTVVIDVMVNVYYGYKINDLAFELQQKIITEVEKATNYKVEAVNVNVIGVVFRS